MSAQVAADLRAAADVLERDGWTQGLLVDDNGCRCLMGAMDTVYQPRIKASGSLEDEIRILDEENAAYNLICDVIGKRAFTNWNDAPGRTAAEVIAALRAAADRAEADQ